MSAMRLTTKRQATLPKTLCEEMGVRAGDAIEVEKAVVNGKQVWCLRPNIEERAPAWFGQLRRFARGKPHDMESIRKSIEEARKRGRK